MAILTANIGSVTDTDIVATLDTDTGILSVSGIGATKEIQQPSRDTGGIFDDGGEYSYFVKKISISEGITELNGDCFYYMKNATEVEIPSTLQVIGERCFFYCSSVPEFVIPDGLKTIKDDAFYGCTNSVAVIQSRDVVIYNTLSSIFPNTLNVKKIKGYSGSTAETYAKTYDVPFEFIDPQITYPIQIGTPNAENVSLTFDSDTGIMTISGNGEFLPLGSIENLPSSITKDTKILNIGNGITKIPASMFSSNPESLEQISFPDTLSEIGGGNFNSCSKITELAFPKSLRKISGGCFVSLTSLQTVTFSEGLETIEGGAFSNCPLVKNLVFPSTLKTMPMAFGSSTLESVEIGGENVSFVSSGSGIANVSAKNLIIRGGTIYSGAFSGKNIEALELKSTVKLNGSAQFVGCRKLKSALIENGITGISTACFNNCVLIDSIELPNSVVELGESAFAGCSSLKSITLSINIKKIPNSCFSGTGFETFSIPNESGVEEIQDDIFYNCSSLKNIYIGKNVKTINSKAFRNVDSPIIKISQEENSISGAPWGATNATIEWISKYITKIEVISLPNKVKYKKGESFDTSGLTVKAIYSDETAEEITDYALSSPDMSSVGTKKVTVTYQNQTTAFNISVIDIIKIEITTLPSKIEYRKGSKLDTSGMVVSTVWTDGSKEVLADGYTVSDLDSTETGEKTITVTYQTFTATFVVTVVANTAGIRISHYPDKIYYKIGDQLNTSGLSVMKYREDGSEEEVFRYNVSGFDSSKSGNSTVRVFYTEIISSTESETFSTTFSVKITNDGQNPFEENFDPINITVHWINGEFQDLTNENIQQSSITLQESICSENYFIFGGCVCNQISFSAHHKQFDGTGEEHYPTGRIEVYLERNKTKLKIFTGEIDTAERASNSLTRNFIAYDYLYKLRNTDIAWWYKNRTVDSQMVFTQKQFRDALFAYLGIEQVETTLEYDNASVPNTNVSNEINVINIIKDLCLQNSVFGWMNRDGKFEYLKLPENSYQFGTTVSGVKIYKYFESQIHLDTFKSFYAKEGRIWFPQEFMADPYPGIFSSGEPSAQEAYEKNIYYNRNSFFVGNQDWLNMAFDADEYGVYTRSKPLVNLCYGTTSKLDPSHLYRAQEYTAEVEGNPFNMVGQTVELRTVKYLDDGTELPVLVNSYIMSRTLKISGGTSLIDTYSAKNSPYNGNNQQLGKYTPEISATVNQTRSELPTISYEEFSDGTDIATMADDGVTVKKAQLRCIKRIKKADYDTLVATGTDRKDTLYFTYEEE